ncbi:hypothetical protein MalM14_21770 [Gimesia chilikensis]|nr:hypothetical protein MalM14_21770 [Gimesia chilikensis]
MLFLIQMAGVETYKLLLPTEIPTIKMIRIKYGDFKIICQIKPLDDFSNLRMLQGLRQATIDHICALLKCQISVRYSFSFIILSQKFK